jgi:hypothetical protein
VSASGDVLYEFRSGTFDDDNGRRLECCVHHEFLLSVVLHRDRLQSGAFDNMRQQCIGKAELIVVPAVDRTQIPIDHLRKGICGQSDGRYKD